MTKILFIGDISGRAGREAVKKYLPSLKRLYRPSLIAANAENLTHGVGALPRHIEEMQKIGIEFFTGGNHIFARPELFSLMKQKESPLIRPLNYSSKYPGRGYKLIKLSSHKKILFINLGGQLFSPEPQPSLNPFKIIKPLLKSYPLTKVNGIIVDFHAETTSEKSALAYFLDGQVSAVVGTHTHIPTADARILPKGTAFISDVGMTGVKESILGADVESALQTFTQSPYHLGKLEPARGEARLRAVLITIDDKTHLAKSIKLIQKG